MTGSWALRASLKLGTEVDWGGAWHDKGTSQPTVSSQSCRQAVREGMESGATTKSAMSTDAMAPGMPARKHNKTAQPVCGKQQAVQGCS